MESSSKIHIIYTDAEMLLSRRDFGSWREIQDAYETFKASLGPCSVDEVVEYLEDEYLELSPAARVQMDTFLAGGAETLVLEFRGA